jgi:hypothetical protein
VLFVFPRGVEPVEVSESSVELVLTWAPDERDLGYQDLRRKLIAASTQVTLDSADVGQLLSLTEAIEDLDRIEGRGGLPDDLQKVQEAARAVLS